MIPAGLHIESGWSDEERKSWLDKKARPDGFVFDEMKKEKEEENESNTNDE
jgi:hypothetical protein